MLRLVPSATSSPAPLLESRGLCPGRRDLQAARDRSMADHGYLRESRPSHHPAGFWDVTGMSGVSCLSLSSLLLTPQPVRPPRGPQCLEHAGAHPHVRPPHLYRPPRRPVSFACESTSSWLALSTANTQTRRIRYFFLKLEGWNFRNQISENKTGSCAAPGMANRLRSIPLLALALLSTRSGLPLGGRLPWRHSLAPSGPLPSGAAPGPPSTEHWTYGMAGMSDHYTNGRDQPLVINKNARPSTFD